MGKKIGALIVLYNPDYKCIISALDVLTSQVDGICIIDNSNESHKAWFTKYKSITYIALFKNTGIATAQNIGIKNLEKAGYDMVLFSDQDSIAYPNLVERLLSAKEILESKGHKVATLGCNAIDKETNYIYTGHVKKRKKIVINSRELIIVDSMRSSMTLTDIATFHKVGYMDEKLFIDDVDYEWCWRALSKCELKTYLVCDAYIYHSLGHNGRMIMNKLVTIPSSFRLFYQYRNYLWLLRRGYVPIKWKLRNGVKYIVKVFYYGLLCEPRIKNMKSIYKGLMAGLKNN